MKKALSLVLTMCMVLSLFATFVISASAEEAVNLAAGKTYTTTAPNRSDNFDDDGKKLTDGIAGQEDPGTKFSNIWNNTDKSTPNVVEVVVDLGEVSGSDTYVVYFAGGNWGIGLPSEGTSMEVFVSDKADSGFVSVASASKSDMVLKSGDGASLDKWSVYTLTAKAPAAVSGRYVKFVITAEAIGNAFVMFDEVEVYSAEASAVVEDKVINLLAQPGTVAVGNLEANDLEYTLDENGFTATCLGTQWPNVTLNFDEALLVDVEGAYIEFEATVEGGNGASIRIKGPVDESALGPTDDIYLHQFGHNIPLDTSGDIPSGNTISYKLPLSEMAFCNYNSDVGYAGKVDFGADQISFNAIFICVSGNGATATIKKLNLVIPGEASNVVKETIAVDGEVNDTGWAKKGWINVSGENGSWQYPTKKEVAEGAVIPTFTYKFQLRADDTKLYGALVLDGVHEEDKNIKVRVWFRDNDEATVYSSFYDFVLAPDGTLTTAAKYNTSTTENKGAAIEPTTLEAVAKVVDGKTVFEFSVNVDEVTKDGNFDYFVCLERKQGVNTGTLYYPFVPELNETSPHGNYPWLLWYAENDATVEVEDIVLGEIVVSDKEEADTSMMGTAPADPAFTVTLATEDGWKAGEKLVVTATVDVLKDGVDLSQILFNLYYDAADVEIVLPEELGAIITAGAESWKEDSLFTLSVDGDYGVIECAPATTVEADVLKKGTQLVMTFEFTVKADAEGLINFQLSNKGLTGYSWDIDAAEVAGAGSSLAVGNADELGDTGIYVIAALALVALIGTAIVIKKRA